MSIDISYCPYCGDQLPEQERGVEDDVAPRQLVCDSCDRLFPRRINWSPTAKNWASFK